MSTDPIIVANIEVRYDPPSPPPSSEHAIGMAAHLGMFENELRQRLSGMNADVEINVGVKSYDRRDRVTLCESNFSRVKGEQSCHTVT